MPERKNAAQGRNKHAPRGAKVLRRAAKNARMAKRCERGDLEEANGPTTIGNSNAAGRRRVPPGAVSVSADLIPDLLYTRQRPG